MSSFYFHSVHSLGRAVPGAYFDVCRHGACRRMPATELRACSLTR